EKRRELPCGRPSLRPAPCAPVGRYRRGMQQGSCRIRWEQKSAWSGRLECAANPAPVAQSACQTAAQTTPPREDVPRLATPEGIPYRHSSPKLHLRQPFAPKEGDLEIERLTMTVTDSRKIESVLRPRMIDSTHAQSVRPGYFLSFCIYRTYRSERLENALIKCRARVRHRSQCRSPSSSRGSCS